MLALAAVTFELKFRGGYPAKMPKAGLGDGPFHDLETVALIGIVRWHLWRIFTPLGGRCCHRCNTVTVFVYRGCQRTHQLPKVLLQATRTRW
jgi:hypothetical protein